jgi:RHS repeat-associated protein
MQGAGGVGGLLLITDHSALITSHYPTYDGNGNISEYLTATGAIAVHFEYDPFGNTTINTDTTNQFTYKFSTKPQDIETGLYYYGYRYYDAIAGRWPSRDPIEEKGGINMYGFVGNDGVNKWDVLGLVMLTYSQISFVADVQCPSGRHASGFSPDSYSNLQVISRTLVNVRYSRLGNLLGLISNIAGVISMGETYVYSTYHEVKNAKGKLQCTDSMSQAAADVITIPGNAKITFQEVDLEVAHELPSGGA